MIVFVSTIFLACSDRVSKDNTSTSTADDTSTEAVSQYPVCVSSCSTAADCGTVFAYMDEDNYSCENNTCVYTGCNSDAECADLGDYVCAEYENTKTCVQSCSVPADCSNGFAYMDEDNYACEAGSCVYLGCNSDAECTEIGDYVCHSTGGFSSCLASCQASADCAMDALYADADNYSCEDNACVYTGCNSDAECADLGDYVCALP